MARTLRKSYCQGCGNPTSHDLVCPKCSDVGRTSFFCSQECFSANWSAHNKLHVLMKQQAVGRPAMDFSMAFTEDPIKSVAPNQPAGSEGNGLSPTRTTGDQYTDVGLEESASQKRRLSSSAHSGLNPDDTEAGIGPQSSTSTSTASTLSPAPTSPRPITGGVRTESHPLGVEGQPAWPTDPLRPPLRPTSESENDDTRVSIPPETHSSDLNSALETCAVQSPRGRNYGTGVQSGKLALPSASSSSSDNDTVRSQPSLLPTSPMAALGLSSYQALMATPMVQTVSGLKRAVTRNVGRLLANEKNYNSPICSGTPTSRGDCKAGKHSGRSNPATDFTLSPGYAQYRGHGGGRHAKSDRSTADGGGGSSPHWSIFKFYLALGVLCLLLVWFKVAKLNKRNIVPKQAAVRSIPDVSPGGSPSDSQAGELMSMQAQKKRSQLRSSEVVGNTIEEQEKAAQKPLVHHQHESLKSINSGEAGGGASQEEIELLRMKLDEQQKVIDSLLHQQPKVTSQPPSQNAVPPWLEPINKQDMPAEITPVNPSQDVQQNPKDDDSHNAEVKTEASHNAVAKSQDSEASHEAVVKSQDSTLTTIRPLGDKTIMPEQLSRDAVVGDNRGPDGEAQPQIKPEFGVPPSAEVAAVPHSAP